MGWKQVRARLVQRVVAGIPTRVHGIIDYAVGAGLLAAPEALGLQESRGASNFTCAMGAAAIAYSLCTDYELSVLKLLPMPVHLRVDAAWSAVLAAGPWLFGFGRRGLRYWVPHTVVALAAAAIIVLSDTEPPGSHEEG